MSGRAKRSRPRLAVPVGEWIGRSPMEAGERSGVADAVVVADPSLATARSAAALAPRTAADLLDRIYAPWTS